MKKADVVANQESSSQENLYKQLNDLLNQKPTSRKEMAILLDKRSNAIVSLVKAREEDAALLKTEKSRVDASNLYIIALALEIEKQRSEFFGEEQTNFFTLTIPKTELVAIIKENTITWSESEDKTEVVIQIGRVPEEIENEKVGEQSEISKSN